MDKLQLIFFFISGFLVSRLIIKVRLPQKLVYWFIGQRHLSLAKILFYLIVISAFLSFFIPNAITVFKEMLAAGTKVRPAIRLDSGDLARLSKIAYQKMTEAGLEDPLIVASNDLAAGLAATDDPPDGFVVEGSPAGGHNSIRPFFSKRFST